MKAEENQIEICENCKKQNNCNHRALIHKDSCRVNDCDYYCEVMSQEKQIEEIETIIKSNLAEGSFANAFARKVAIQIAEHYQPKLPKDNVVLSADEFANLKKYAYKKGSKETAKEFYDKFNENICYFKLENKSEEYKDGYTQAIADICGKLDQTAVELGVDLKEYYGK